MFNHEPMSVLLANGRRVHQQRRGRPDSSHCKKAVINSDVDKGGANQTTWGSENSYSTSFGSAPPLSTSEFGAFLHGFFYSAAEHNYFITESRWACMCGCSSSGLLGALNWACLKIMLCFDSLKNRINTFCIFLPRWWRRREGWGYCF